MSKLLNFDIKSVEIEEDNKPYSQFATAKIRVFSTGKNLHKLYCSKETLIRTAPTIYEKPIIFELKYGLGFGSHPSDKERAQIAGFVEKDSAEFFVDEFGNDTFTVTAKIWKMYAHKFLEVFLGTDTTKAGNSVEMELMEQSDYPNAEGYTEMLDFAYTATCVLGFGVTPASPNSHIEILSFAKGEILSEKQKFDAALRLEFSKYNSIDFTIPAPVKKNAKKALELYKAHSGATSVSLATGRHLANNVMATPEKVRAIAKYTSYHKDKPKDKSLPDGAYISYLCYGGDSGCAWASDLVTKMNDADSKSSAYFSSTKESDEDTKNKDTENKNSRSSTSKEEKLEDNKEEMAVEDPKKEEMAATEMAVEVEVEVEKEDEKDKEDEDEKDEQDNSEDKEDDKEEMAAPVNAEMGVSYAEGEKPVEKTEMSLDSNLDLAAALAMLADDTIAYQELVNEHKVGKFSYEKAFGMAYAKMCKMSEQLSEFAKAKEERDALKAENEVYMTEMSALREFKAKIESQQFAYKVESVLNSVKEDLNKDQLEDAREGSKNFSEETFGQWKNQVEALAFAAVKGGGKAKKVDPNEPVRFGLPYPTGNTGKNLDNNYGLW